MQLTQLSEILLGHNAKWDSGISIETLMGVDGSVLLRLPPGAVAGMLERDPR